MKKLVKAVVASLVAIGMCGVAQGQVRPNTGLIPAKSAHIRTNVHVIDIQPEETVQVPFNGRTIVEIQKYDNGFVEMLGGAYGWDNYGQANPATTVMPIYDWTIVGAHGWANGPFNMAPDPVNGIRDFDHLSAVASAQSTGADSVFQALDGSFFDDDLGMTLADTGMVVTNIRMESWVESTLNLPAQMALRGPGETTTVTPPQATFQQGGQSLTPEQMQQQLQQRGFSQPAAQAATNPTTPIYPFTQEEWDILRTFEVTVKYEVTVEVQAGLSVPATATVKVGGKVGVDMKGPLTSWLSAPGIGAKVATRLANDAKILCEQGLNAAKEFVQRAIDQASAWLQQKLNDPNLPWWQRTLIDYLLRNMGNIFHVMALPGEFPNQFLDGAGGGVTDTRFALDTRDQMLLLT